MIPVLQERIRSSRSGCGWGDPKLRRLAPRRSPMPCVLQQQQRCFPNVQGLHHEERRERGALSSVLRGWKQGLLCFVFSLDLVGVLACQYLQDPAPGWPQIAAYENGYFLRCQFKGC